MIHRIEKLSWVAAGICTLYMCLNLVPFSFFVPITKLEAADACVGDTEIMVTNERTTLFGMEIVGEVTGQLIFFDDGIRYETTIYRARPDGGQSTANDPTEFRYEQNTTGGTFGLQLTGPIQRPGTYGMREVVTIHPFPFIHITTVNEAEKTMFNVIECE